MNGRFAADRAHCPYDWSRAVTGRRGVVGCVFERQSSPCRSSGICVLMGVIIVVPALVGAAQFKSQLGDPLLNPVEKGHRVLENPFTIGGFWQHMVDYYRFQVFGGL